MVDALVLFFSGKCAPYFGVVGGWICWIFTLEHVGWEVRY